MDISERVKRAVAEVLLVPYYFMAGRLNFNKDTKRMELLCNNAGALFVAATSRLALKDLGNLSLPNSTFHHFIHRPGLYKSLAEKALLTIQALLLLRHYYCLFVLLVFSVTRFSCGSFSIGFMTNHGIVDGKSAGDMFENLASICRGEGLKAKVVHNDRTYLKARNPPIIKYPHKEYVNLSEISSSASSFTAPDQLSPSPLVFANKFKYIHKLFSFSPEMIKSLKGKAQITCTSFEAIVAHVWRARSMAVFDNLEEYSTVLFAVDIRSKISPNLPDGFVGNGVITAFATAKVGDLVKKPLSFSVGKMKEGRERVTDEYIRSVIDWLEVHRGIPATRNGNFYVSAWWKLPFNELDFGFGKASHGGPVLGGNDEFVLLLSDGKSMENGGGGINVWMGLEQEKMKRFMVHILEI
ncbi:hypothetical protein GH714_029347 [Hevea brasiliensis]|uniref:Omega-hydroxypalmitate O-feruloyl transferase n=1 Tax=Hevea brasiliensis TaxID=3981 RepID=A0A6A6KLJ5_HEVBR|nr:hypothetical protein GH714_029347 [Hevea brasiliensis]